MRVLEKFEMDFGEVQDFDIPFTDYLASMSDTGLSHVVVSDVGITVDASTLVNGIVKVWVSNATAIKGQKYLITAELTTTGGRVHYGSISVKIRR